MVTFNYFQRITCLNILVDWNISLLHSECNKISGKSEIQRGQHNINLGPFSEHECDLIKMRWNEFCKVFKLLKININGVSLWISWILTFFCNVFFQKYGFMRNEYKAFIPNKQLYISQKEKLKFVQFLAQDLPNRPLYCVYNRFQNLYCKKYKGRWEINVLCCLWYKIIFLFFFIGRIAVCISQIVGFCLCEFLSRAPTRKVLWPFLTTIIYSETLRTDRDP